MQIDKSQISVSATLKNDAYGNLFTVWKLGNADLVNALFDCQEYQERYFNDQIISVPIPPTKNGHPVIFSTIIKLTDRNFSFYNQALEKSPFDEANYVLRNYINLSISQPACFAELIAIQRGGGFEIINIKGMMVKDMPPHPYEIVRNRKKDPCKYTYSMDDLCNSTEFWAHHDFAIKQL